jgi:hypothetical protein
MLLLTLPYPARVDDRRMMHVTVAINSFNPHNMKSPTPRSIAVVLLSRSYISSPTRSTLCDSIFAPSGHIPVADRVELERACRHVDDDLHQHATTIRLVDTRRSVDVHGPDNGTSLDPAVFAFETLRSLFALGDVRIVRSGAQLLHGRE